MNRVLANPAYAPRTPDACSSGEPMNASDAATAGAATDRAEKLYRHWRKAAGDRIMPAKSDLRPEMLGRVLPSIVLYEYHNPELIQFRVAGSSFRAIHGRELTGTNFLDMMKGDDRRKTWNRMHALLSFPCGILTTNTALFESGSRGFYRSYGLPLADADGTPKFTIHVSEYVSGDTLPSFGKVIRMGAAEANYLDIGAGIPDFTPPI